MLAWRFLTYPGNDEDVAFLAFAILLLATHIEHREDRGQWLKEIAIWVEDQEVLARNGQSRYRSSFPHWDRWLLGLTHFDLREAVWRSLAHRTLLCPERPHPREACEELQLLGELVAGN